MPKIIENEPSYVFNVREYKEHSAILSVLTLNYGKISVMVRGSSARSVLQPFTPLKLTLVSSNGDLFFLKDYECCGNGFTFKLPILFCATYINELLYYLYHSKESNPVLFGTYVATLEALHKQRLVESSLRVFELTLLDCLGYGLSPVDHTGQPLLPRQLYRFGVGIGFIKVNAPEPNNLSKQAFLNTIAQLQQAPQSTAALPVANSSATQPSAMLATSSSAAVLSGSLSDSSQSLYSSQSSRAAYVSGSDGVSGTMGANGGLDGVGDQGSKQSVANWSDDELESAMRFSKRKVKGPKLASNSYTQSFSGYATADGRPISTQELIGPALYGDQLSKIVVRKFDSDSLKQSKQLTNALFQFLLGKREIKSRQMYHDYLQVQAKNKLAQGATSQADQTKQAINTSSAYAQAPTQVPTHTQTQEQTSAQSPSNARLGSLDSTHLASEAKKIAAVNPLSASLANAPSSNAIDKDALSLGTIQGVLSSKAALEQEDGNSSLALSNMGALLGKTVVAANTVAATNNDSNAVANNTANNASVIEGNTGANSTSNTPVSSQASQQNFNQDSNGALSIASSSATATKAQAESNAGALGESDNSSTPELTGMDLLRSLNLGTLAQAMSNHTLKTKDKSGSQESNESGDLATDVASLTSSAKSASTLDSVSTASFVSTAKSDSTPSSASTARSDLSSSTDSSPSSDAALAATSKSASATNTDTAANTELTGMDLLRSLKLGTLAQAMANHTLKTKDKSTIQEQSDNSSQVSGDDSKSGKTQASGESATKAASALNVVNDAEVTSKAKSKAKSKENSKALSDIQSDAQSVAQSDAAVAKTTKTSKTKRVTKGSKANQDQVSSELADKALEDGATSAPKCRSRKKLLGETELPASETLLELEAKAQAKLLSLQQEEAAKKPRKPRAKKAKNADNV